MVELPTRGGRDDGGEAGDGAGLNWSDSGKNGQEGTDLRESFRENL